MEYFKMEHFNHYMNTCNYRYISLFISIHLYTIHQSNMLLQNHDYNKKEGNNSPGTPAFIHGEMSVPSAYPSSLVVLIGANNFTTSSMICCNAKKNKALLSFLTVPNIYPHCHVFLGWNRESWSSTRSLTFCAAVEPENCRATGAKVPESDSMTRSKLDRFPWSGTGHRRESNENMMRNKTIILTIKENVLLHLSTLKLG